MKGSTLLLEGFASEKGVLKCQWRITFSIFLDVELGHSHVCVSKWKHEEIINHIPESIERWEADEIYGSRFLRGQYPYIRFGK